MSPAVPTEPSAAVRLVRCVLIAYLALMLAALHWPIELLPGPPPGIWDKVPHFSFYAVLAGLLVWHAVARRHARGIRGGWGGTHLAILAGLAGFAALDEITQPLTDRTRDLLDWCADILGVITVLAPSYLWLSSRSAAPKNRSERWPTESQRSASPSASHPSRGN